MKKLLFIFYIFLLISFSTKMSFAMEEIVTMDDGEFVITKPNEYIDRILYTGQISACTITVVYLEFENGTRKCALTHYPMRCINSNVEKIRDLIQQMIDGEVNITKKVILISAAETKEKEFAGPINELESKIKQLANDTFDKCELKIQSYDQFDVEEFIEQHKDNAFQYFDDNRFHKVICPSDISKPVILETWLGKTNLIKTT